MKILSRIVMVFALLGGLAYGSFAFGKYVLSNKLFGDAAPNGALRTVSRSTSEATAVTRHTNWKGTKPRVEVKVLSAGEAGPTPQDSALADEDNLSTERHGNTDPTFSSAPTQPGKLGVRRFDDAPLEYSIDGKNDEGSTRRRRRRRRRSDSARTTLKPKPAETVPGGDESAPAGDGRNTSNAGNDNGDSSSISVTTSDDSTPSRPRAQSDSTSDTPRPRSRERRRRRTRERRQSQDSSPVPKPEGSGSSNSSSGDSADTSPVPQPE